MNAPAPYCRILVREADFDTGAELAELAAADGTAAEIGGIASFTGLVRRDKRRDKGSATPGAASAAGQDEVLALTLEHYPGMTERQLHAIAAEACRRWPLTGVVIIHRVGRLLPGERIVLVACASAHRDAAFDGCRFLMDWLKTRAPFWKREETPAGERWVDARASDTAAAERW